MRCGRGLELRKQEFTVSAGALGNVAVRVFDGCCHCSVCHRCRYFFGIGMLTAVCVGYIIFYTVERNSLDSALVVVCVLHGIVTALDLGYHAKRAGLRGAVFLARLGAVGDGGYRAVLVSTVRELAAVGKTFDLGENLKNQTAEAVWKNCFLINVKQ